MQDFMIGAVDCGARAELQDAAGIRGDDGLGLSLLHRVHFAREQFERRFGFRDVVHTC